MRLDDGIVHVAAGEHVGKRVPHEFADAQLALRASGRGVAMMFVSHRHRPNSSVIAGPARVISVRRARAVLSSSGCSGQQARA
jgi:hypothetical protein